MLLISLTVQPASQPVQKDEEIFWLRGPAFD